MQLDLARSLCLRRFVFSPSDLFILAFFLIRLLVKVVSLVLGADSFYFRVWSILHAQPNRSMVLILRYSVLVLIPVPSQSSANLSNELFEESLACGDLSLSSALAKVHRTMGNAIFWHSMIFHWVCRSELHHIICALIDFLLHRHLRRILMESAMICRIFVLILNPVNLVSFVSLV